MEARLAHSFLIRRSRESATRKVGVIACYRCGTEAEMPMNKESSMPFEPTAKYFRNRGWEIGKRRSDDVCPNCQKRQKSSAKHDHKEQPVMKLVPAAAPPVDPVPAAAPALVPDPPRPMSRDERRIIFEKLNDLYVNEKTGYAPGWTDEKVAKDLGTPRAWVAQVRDEMFGPVGANPEITELLTEAREVLSAIRSDVIKAKKDYDRSLAAWFTSESRANDIEKKIVAIEKQVGLRS